ncbi:glycosyltransferase [Acidiferrimicrobium sp. IK]|uniref:glycosyltransferase family 2 protein n=1 Tax=Acidiferrimicrobium sp. IK TaxID=2871700 RepID=UPI0021CB8D84|nr:glycosyltransferase family 2 protein [Acidiferrimicrobium sp. IK]MCU4185059.1 glycosyltransferase [Acidiferrimicrobium sp. IK]
MTPLVSIVIPAYNDERYIETTIESALNQTYPNVEVVVVDDRSSDCTYEIATSLQRPGRPLRVVRNERNLGLTGNFAESLRHATGEYVKILIHDDVLLPQAIEASVPALDDPSVAVAVTRRVRIDAAGGLIPDDAYNQPLVTQASAIPGLVLGDFLLERQMNMIGEPTEYLFRRADIDPDTFASINGYTFMYTVDLVLLFALLAKGKCWYDPRQLCCNRRHPDQVSSNPLMPPIDRAEWGRMLLDFADVGFLADPAQRARAYSTFVASALTPQMADPANGISDYLGVLGRVVERLAQIHDEHGPARAQAIQAAHDRMAWGAPSDPSPSVDADTPLTGRQYRVCVVTPAAADAAAKAAIDASVSELRNAGHSVTVAQVGGGPGGEGDKLAWDTIDGVETVTIRRNEAVTHPDFGDPATERMLRRVLWERGIEVTHVHGEVGQMPTSLLEAAWMAGTRVVVTAHAAHQAPPAADPELLEARAAYLTRVGRLCDAVTTTSPDVVTALSGAPWLPGAVHLAGPGSWAQLYRNLEPQWRPDTSALRATVVVATYNRAADLERCLEGFARQTCDRARFEVIVVDDSSRETMEPVVAAFRDRLEVAFVRHDENRGLGEARRSGVVRATGDIVILFDDDDIPADGLVAEHLRQHSVHPGETHAVLGFTGIHPDLEMTAALYHSLMVGQQYFAYPSLNESQPVPWYCGWGGRISYKRTLLEKVPPRGRWLEDSDLNLRINGQYGLVVHYARGAVQYLTDPLDLERLLTRSRRLGSAAVNLVASYPSPELTAFLRVHDAPQGLANLSAAVAEAENIAQQLGAHDLATLRRSTVVMGGKPQLAESIYHQALTLLLAEANLAGQAVELLIGRHAPTRFAYLASPDRPDELADVLGRYFEAFGPDEAVELLVCLPEARVTSAEAELSVRELSVRLGYDPSSGPSVKTLLHAGTDPMLGGVVWLRPGWGGRSLPGPSLRLAEGGADLLRRAAGLQARTEALR